MRLRPMYPRKTAFSPGPRGPGRTPKPQIVDAACGNPRRPIRRIPQPTGQWRTWLAICCLWVPAPGANAQPASTCTHIYEDADGRTLCANGWQDVPEVFRSTARPTSPGSQPPSQPGTAFWAWDPESEPERSDTIYKYRDKSGRECFTNVWDQVPAARRSRAEALDLSQVTLNTEVGTQIDQRHSEQQEKPVNAEYCEQARSKASEGWASNLWTENRVLIGVAGLLLLFLFATPVALRKLHAPDWSRTLTMAIQTLGLIGLIMYGMVRANSAYQSFRQGLEICEGSAWTEGSTRPNPVKGHVRLIRDLQSQIDDAVEQERSVKRERAIDGE